MKAHRRRFLAEVFHKNNAFFLAGRPLACVENLRKGHIRYQRGDFFIERALGLVEARNDLVEVIHFLQINAYTIPTTLALEVCRSNEKRTDPWMASLH